MKTGTLVQFTLILLTAATLAHTAEPETLQSLLSQLDAQAAQQKQLIQRIARQQARIDQLEARSEHSWLDTRRVEQTRQLVREVLADAETRAALAEGGVTAGWNNGFYLASDDGNYLLKIKGMVQARYVFNHRDQSGDDDDRGGFDNSRTRFGFIGHVIDPTWKYIIWTGHHYDGETKLLDVSVTKTLGGDWYVTGGQFKIPFWREWLVSETSQQFVERSMLSGKFGGSYTQGVKVGYGGERLHAELAFSDGAAALNTPWNTEDTDYAVSGRAEWLLTGDWKQYRTWESWRGDDPLVILGSAFHAQSGEYGTTNDERDIVRFTGDVSIGFGGANLFLAFVSSRDANGDTLNQHGLLVQGGVFLTESLELIARYEYGDADTGGDDTLSVLTVGANYFFARHAARLTVDLGYAFEPISSEWASTFAGYQADAIGQDGQLTLRAQFQLLF